MKYAGVGARATPQNVLATMRAIAAGLAEDGWTLRSGAAVGADSAFEAGADEHNGKKEIYLPWPKFNDHESNLSNPPDEAFRIASEAHPGWAKCSSGARKMHARNACQVLGASLTDPCRVLVCWTEKGQLAGGTATAIRIAKAYNVEVINLGKKAYINLTPTDILDRITPLGNNYQPSLF